VIQIVFGAADSIDAAKPVKPRETIDPDPVKNILGERLLRSHALVASCLHLIYALTTAAFVIVVIANLVQAR
jgi:hypothetical protein